jgi:hypothetical protein
VALTQLPCHATSYNVKGRVPLLAVVKLAVQLVDIVPFNPRLDLVFGHRMEEIAGVGQAVGTERAQFGQLVVASPDLADVSTRRAVWKVDLVALATLDDGNLARLGERILLGHNQKVPIAVGEEGLVGHVGIADVDVRGDTLEEGWVAGTSHSLQTL